MSIYDSIIIKFNQNPFNIKNFATDGKILLIKKNK
jgi:hypothetical protein